jgi:hypothetical protein
MNAALRTADPLADPLFAPERPHYATGMMLGAEDFLAEQAYHRGRVARARAWLHGVGTVAGLRAGILPATGAEAEQLMVEPGLALDRLGRLIEIPRPACLDLARWMAALTPDQRTAALHPKDAADPLSGLVADVFVRFVQCPHALTPALAAGPFDALDAVQPARLRDGFELTLVPRAETLPPLPQNAWPDLAAIADPAARAAAFRDAVFDLWPADTRDLDGRGQLPPLAEHVSGQDTSSLWLARLSIPVTGDPPERAAGNIVIDNASRPFVPAAARWIGA